MVVFCVPALPFQLALRRGFTTAGYDSSRKTARKSLSLAQKYVRGISNPILRASFSVRALSKAMSKNSRFEGAT